MKVSKDAVVEEIHGSEVADYKGAPEEFKLNADGKSYNYQPSPEAKKHNRHVQIALDHLGKRRVALQKRVDDMYLELEEVKTAISALE